MRDSCGMCYTNCKQSVKQKRSYSDPLVFDNANGHDDNKTSPIEVCTTKDLKYIARSEHFTKISGKSPHLMTAKKGQQVLMAMQMAPVWSAGGRRRHPDITLRALTPLSTGAV
eukprot:5901561-Amphidinium_carterae.2